MIVVVGVWVTVGVLLGVLVWVIVGVRVIVAVCVTVVVGVRVVVGVCVMVGVGVGVGRHSAPDEPPGMVEGRMLVVTKPAEPAVAP